MTESDSPLPEKTGTPSAPPIEPSESQAAPSSAYPNIQQAPANPEPRPEVLPSAVPAYPIPGGYPGPPPPLPSYQDAINYPTAAPYGQPQMNPTFPPKPYPNMGYPPTVPIPTVPTNPNANVIHVRNAPGAHSAPVVVHVTTGTCPVCGGNFRRRLSVIYVLCLIGLCMFAFPLALVFLCFLPCAYSYRCSNCGRTPY